MSLRLRINLVITLVTVAFTLAMVYEMVNDLRSSVREEIESTTRVAVQLVETVVAAAVRSNGAKHTAGFSACEQIPAVQAWISLGERPRPIR